MQSNWRKQGSTKVTRGKAFITHDDVWRGEQSQSGACRTHSSKPSSYALTWKHSALDTTIIKEKTWKTYNAIFPVIFLQLNLEKGEKKPTTTPLS